MPQIATFQIATSEVKINDTILHGGTVASVKTGTKWTELRDSNSALLVRRENDAIITVERAVPTDEELAEFEAAKKARHDEAIKSMLEQSVKSYVVKHVAYEHKVDATADITSDAFQRMMGGQAMRKVANRVLSIVTYMDDAHLEVPNDQRYSTAAAAMWAERNQPRSYASDPLSRSTSVLVNVLEDVTDWAWNDFFASACYGLDYSAWTELTGEALNRYNAS